MAHNKGDLPVLIVEGEELVGALQNRVLNATVLLPAGKKTKLRVCCVERGRWHPADCARHDLRFMESEFLASKRIRDRLNMDVRKSLVRQRDFHADQSMVWAFVYEKIQASGAFAPTEALREAMRQREQVLTSWRKPLAICPGQDRFSLLSP